MSRPINPQGNGFDDFGKNKTFKPADRIFGY
jgi:hypothetical protein